MQDNQIAAAIVKGISLKDVGANAKAAAALPDGDTRHIALMRVWGAITALIVQTTDSGDTSYGFGGRFQATNIQEGSPNFNTTFEGPIFWAPSGIRENLVRTIKAMPQLTKDPVSDARKKRDEYAIGDGKALNFAMEIFVKRDSNASGITYVARPLLEPTEADPLEEIRKAMAVAHEKLQAALNAKATGAGPGKGNAVVTGATTPRQLESKK